MTYKEWRVDFSTDDRKSTKDIFDATIITEITCLIFQMEIFPQFFEKVSSFNRIFFELK